LIYVIGTRDKLAVRSHPENIKWYHNQLIESLNCFIRTILTHLYTSALSPDFYKYKQVPHTAPVTRHTCFTDPDSNTLQTAVLDLCCLVFRNNLPRATRRPL